MKALQRAATTIAALTLTVGGSVVGVASPASAASPCGYYVSGGYGYIHNCKTVRLLGSATSTRGVTVRWCLAPGATVWVGWDSGVASAYLSGTRC